MLDSGPIIRNRFGARYVFIRSVIADDGSVADKFYTAAMKSQWFDKVYEDKECIVLHIRDQKGVSPG